MEDFLGYQPPSNEKPHKAYQFINNNWGDSWENVNEDWKKIIKQLSSES